MPPKTNEEILKSSTEIAQKAAEAIGGKFTQGTLSSTGQVLGGFTPITSNDLTPTPPIVPASPSPAPVPALPELSEPEKQVQGDIEKTQELNKKLEGESAYTLEQEQMQGLPELKKTQRDLNAQIKQLQADSLAGTEQIRNTPKSLVAIQRETERFNREIAVKSLGLNALVAATQGNIATANDLVERAVKAKYDPIKEEINTKLKNLDLILKSPSYTNAEKARAQAQKEIQDKAALELEKQKVDFAGIQSISLKAAENNADANTLSRIANAKSQIEALQIAAEKGFLVSTPASAQEYNFAVKNGYTGTYTQYQNEDANRKALVAKAAQNGLPYQVTTQVDKLSSSFDSSPIVKNYNEVQNKKLSVDAILNTKIKGPADLAIVYEFMKALDPTSVVRETEYATAAKSGNIFSGVFARFNGYLKEGGGFLPAQVKKDFQSIINQKFNIATTQYENLRNETARKINIKTGMSDGTEYLTDYAKAVPNQLLDTSNLPPTDTETIGSNAGFFSGLLNLFKK